MLLGASSPEGVRLPGARLADPELEKALLSVSVLPVMVTPLVEPVKAFPVAPSTYPEPPVPVQPDDDQGAMSRVSPLQVAADGPIMYVTTGHQPVLPQWISTFRGRVTCCWGIRRTYPCSRCR